MNVLIALVIGLVIGYVLGSGILPSMSEGNRAVSTSNADRRVIYITIKHYIVSISHKSGADRIIANDHEDIS